MLMTHDSVVCTLMHAVFHCRTGEWRSIIIQIGKPPLSASCNPDLDLHLQYLSNFDVVPHYSEPEPNGVGKVEAEVDNAWLYGHTARDCDVVGFVAKSYVERLGPTLKCRNETLGTIQTSEKLHVVGILH